MNYYLLIKKKINDVDTIHALDYNNKIKYYGNKLIKNISREYSSIKDMHENMNVFDYCIKIDKDTFETILNTEFYSIHDRNIKDVLRLLNLEEYLI